MGAPYFRLKKTVDDQFVFHLVAGNGATIVISERYREKANALKGIESVKKNAPIAEVRDET